MPQCTRGYRAFAVASVVAKDTGVDANGDGVEANMLELARGDDAPATNVPSGL